MIKGKIAKVIDQYNAVMNKGVEDGVEKDMRFIIYTEGETIEDPDSGEELGNVEHVKAFVKPKHVMEKMTVLETDETVQKSTGFATLALQGTRTEKKELAKDVDGTPAEEDVKKGDLVREDIS